MAGSHSPSDSVRGVPDPGQASRALSPPADAGPPSPAEGLDSNLCARFVDDLPVSGASMSVLSGLSSETMVCASDAVAARIDEIQFDLGEGPRWDALRNRTPVLLPHVRSVPHPLWPMFDEALRNLEVGAIFVYPLMLGAIDIGVVELYSAAPGMLSHADQSTALRLAAATSWQLLRQLLTLAHGEGASGTNSAGETSPLSRREIHQATGMVLAQAGTTATDALLMLRAHAFAQGRPVRDVARDVVAKKLDFTPTKGPFPFPPVQ